MTDRPRNSTLAVARDRHMARAAVQFGILSSQVKIVFVAVLLALGLRTLVYEPFNIPSESMQPGLLVGDYLFVAKWPYGYSRYALPLGLPLFDGRLFDTTPERGDVVVFKSPRDNRTDFIKRVVGLPGDRVRMTGGRLEINGVLVPKQRLSDLVVGPVAGTGCLGAPGRTGLTAADGNCHLPRYRETLASGRSFAVLDAVARGARDTTPLVTVPVGHYFALGDNRDDSADSRLSVADGGVGMVPADNLIGRADRIFFSTGGGVRWFDLPGWWKAARFDRIGAKL